MKLIRQLQKKRDLLELSFDALYSGAPKVPWQAFGKVREDLEISEETTLNEKEIDQLLPPQFKRIKPFPKFNPTFDS
jgi:hypothetical protein